MVLDYQLNSVILKARAFSAFFSGQFTFDEGKTWKCPRLFIADSENDENHCRLNNKFRDEKSSFFHRKTFITCQGHLRAFNQWRCHSVTWHFAHILSVLSYYLLFYKFFVLHIFRSTKRNVLPWLRVKTANNVVITTYKKHPQGILFWYLYVLQRKIYLQGSRLHEKHQARSLLIDTNSSFFEHGFDSNYILKATV